MLAVNMKCVAKQLLEDNLAEMAGFVKDKWHSNQEKGFKVRALNGIVYVKYSDWIVKRPDGEIEVYCEEEFKQAFSRT